MNNELSINADKNEINLETNKADLTAIGLKSLLGNTPLIGNLLNEVVNVVIPNQKIDRIKLFIEILDTKLQGIEKEVLEVKMKTEEFTDLFEDALPQAARALSDERREYIATFLKNSLTKDEIEHLGEKKLLSILNELNDAEIIFLKSKVIDYEEEEEFYKTHKKVLEFYPTAIGSPGSEYDFNAIKQSYQDNIERLGLVKPVYKRVNKGEQPEFDEKTGKVKSSYDQVTQLGRLLLRYIDDSFKDDQY